MLKLALYFLTVPGLMIYSITPNFFTIYSDIILIILGALFLRSRFYIICIGFIFFISISKMLLADFYLGRILLPMVRFFIVFGLVDTFIKRYSSGNLSFYMINKWKFFNKKYFKISLFTFGILTFGVNLTSFFDPTIYNFLNSFWAGSVGEQTVANYALRHGGRASSIFSQPATAGLVFGTMMFLLVTTSQDKIEKFQKIGLLIIGFFLTFNGFISGSKVFYFIIVLGPLFVFVFKFIGKDFRFPLLVLISFLPSGLTILLSELSTHGIDYTVFGRDIFGGRFNYNAHTMVTYREFKDVFLLFGFFDHSFRIGDSAILIRMYSAGMLYNFIFISLILISYYRLRSHLSVASYGFICALFFSELGFTAFNQPVVISLVPLLIVRDFLAKASLQPSAIKERQTCQYVA